MHTLPTLPYNYNALVPVIDEATMHLHHEKHHQAYLDKLNAALEKHPELTEKSVSELLKNLSLVPEDIRGAVRNHGGGHVNHSLFWETLAPVGSAATLMPEALTAKLTEDFGSVDNFKTVFKTEGLNRFGSGWVWLVQDASGKLKIISTGNQDSPLSEGLTPLFGADVWEHAYYLTYQNKRGDYLDALWQIVNWQKVAEIGNIN